MLARCPDIPEVDQLGHLARHLIYGRRSRAASFSTSRRNLRTARARPRSSHLAWLSRRPHCRGSGDRCIGDGYRGLAHRRARARACPSATDARGLQRPPGVQATDQGVAGGKGAPCDMALALQYASAHLSQLSFGHVGRSAYRPRGSHALTRHAGDHPPLAARWEDPRVAPRWPSNGLAYSLQRDRAADERRAARSYSVWMN